MHLNVRLCIHQVWKGYKYTGFSLLFGCVSGIRRDLVVTTPGSQVWLCWFASPLGPQNSGLAWLLYKCAALWRTVYGPATERPLGTIRKEKGISNQFRVSISSQYDLSCWKRRKTPNPPSFLWVCSDEYVFLFKMPDNVPEEPPTTPRCDNQPSLLHQLTAYTCNNILGRP